ncbi:hypothetical protein PRIPAC_94094 [Pristionchus pacificus]|uniref:Protein kinase domain-containing protein n=1 Tax=Pristionchus pacificus TaxID=54126 RepID=A0A2A6BP10_PRIPA|nr:hypothetical protein PRIPAC_94094 [Pristionchus pacificus]|eukprot:PDM67644.1 protein kinase [Pristionchus pacificus]
MNDARRSFQQPPDGKKKEKKKLRRLDQGKIVKAKNFTWTIEEILGSGGFGDVYKVRGEKENEVYAMKTEYNDPKQRKSNDRLKIEQMILCDLNNQPDPEKSKHFLKIVDKGQTDSFKWIVMTLVSHSLDVLRRDYLESMTYITKTPQTLKAVEQLHDCGYLHRDIKPHNFAIGIPPKDSTIFMIDFGIARRFMDKDGKLRIPRQTVRFLGTVRFASRSCHNEKEQSRKDDLESWCYMVLDLFNPENITWRRVSDRMKVAVYKHQLFTRQDNKEIDGPKEMYKIIAYVNELGYTDVPNYDKIRDYLLDGAKDEKVGVDWLDLTRKFDWVGVELKKKLNSKKKGPLAANRITDDEEDTEPSKKKKKEERRKRFSMENDDTDSDDDIPLPKPIPRRSVSKIGPSTATASVFGQPSIKGRIRKSGFGPAPGGGSINVSMQKASPAQSGLKMTTGIAPGPRDQSSIQSPCVSTGTTGPRSNYNTAIPRTPSRDGSVMNIPSGRNKGGKKDEGEKKN